MSIPSEQSTRDPSDRSSQGSRLNPAVVTAVVTAVSTVLAALIAGLFTIVGGGGDSTPPNPGPPTTIAVATTSGFQPSTSSPVDSGTTLTTGASEGNRRQFVFADDSRIDLDELRADTSDNGGAQYDVLLNTGRFFTGSAGETWPSKMAIIQDEDASFQGCERSTEVRREVMHLSDVELDQSICVKTNKGRWAVLKIIEVEGVDGLWAEDITFDRWLFA